MFIETFLLTIFNLKKDVQKVENCIALCFLKSTQAIKNESNIQNIFKSVWVIKTHFRKRLHSISKLFN